MKNFLILFLTIIFSLLIYFPAQSQKYLDLMEDNSYNVYDVIQEAEAYFNVHSEIRGGSWKRYQRWRAMNEALFYPSGDRTKLDSILSDKTNNPINTASYQESFTGSNWIELGPYSANTYDGNGNPAPGVGRINRVWVNPNNNNHIRCGAPSGGLWETTNAGLNWTVLTDNVPSPDAGNFAVNPNNTNIIYMKSSGGRGNSSAFVKSVDGGLTWNILPTAGTGLNSSHLHRIVVDPINSSTVYATTTYGFFKSTTAGNTWTELNTPVSSNFINVLLKPDDSNTIYFTRKNSEEYLYKSTDGGATWISKKVFSSNNASSKSYIAVSPADPNYLYFVNEKEGVYLSTNGGISFTRISSVPKNSNNSPYTFMSIGVSDTDPDLFLYGSTDLFAWDSDSSKFTRLTRYKLGLKVSPYQNAYIHADIRYITCQNGIFYVGTDGYVAKSSDNGVTWDRISNGVAVREFNAISSSSSDPYNILGCSQDNGISKYNSSVWSEISVGDGMAAYFNHQTPSTVYGVTARGWCYRSFDGGLTPDYTASQPGINQGTWYTPLIMHPTNGNTLYIGLGEIMKTTDGMDSWTTISSFGAGLIKELAIAKSNPNYIYAAVDDRIWKTTNGGNSWTEISGNLPNSTISSISIHPGDEQKVMITYLSYVSGEKVYHTSNAGNSWVNYSDNLSNKFVTCGAYEDSADDRLYIATDKGIYYKDLTTTGWILYSDNLPPTNYNGLEINQTAGKIRVATYGRGLWETNLVGSVNSSPPISNFIGIPSTICAGESVSFTDNSINSPTSWAWSFAGSVQPTSSSQNPIVTYNNPGSYAVSLSTNNTNGNDTKTINSYITVNESPMADAGLQQTICEGDSVSLTATGGTSYVWDHGLGSGAIKTFAPLFTDTYKVTVTTDGCSDKDSVVVIVDLCTGISDSENNSKLICYFNSENNMVLSLKKIEPGTYSLAVINTLGQIVSQQNIFVSNSEQTAYINIDSNAKGLHFIKLYNGTRQFVGKVMKR